MDNKKEIKNCWKCKKSVEINEYGYGICFFDHAIVVTDSRHYKIIQRDGTIAQV